MPILKSGQAQRSKLELRNSSPILNQQDLLKSIEGRILSATIVNINQSRTSQNGIATVKLSQSPEVGASNEIVGVLPLFPNVKNYPLINETVLIVSIANSKDEAIADKGRTAYYFSPINLWNTNQSNPSPLPSTKVTPPSQGKSYQQVEATNNPNKPSPTNNTVFKPGTYFNENNTVNPVYPYEGDYIIDGRFGNSLRFGNTVPNTLTTVPNNWSHTGSVGDPITILTNQTHKENPIFNSITEDINRDGSSAYFTSTQEIPIRVSSKNGYLSYGDNKPTSPEIYTEKQIILNSGRLLFNSTQDHILLSSQKSINLNSQESVNVDARTEMVIQTPNLYLGGIETAQPVVLGNDLVSLLNKIINDLNTLTAAMASQKGVPEGATLAPLSGKAFLINQKIGDYKAELSNILSNTTKTV